jgi:hypothetical protein
VRPTRPNALKALLAACAAAALVGAPAASASAPEGEMLTYMPTELIYSAQTPLQVHEELSVLDSYDIGQALLQMPRFSKAGKLKLRGAERQMIPLWASSTAAYDGEHGAALSAVAVFNAQLGSRGPDLQQPGVRANMIAGVSSVLAMGVQGVQLDVEPFPETTGFTALLEELGAALSRRGFAGRFSVVAPADVTGWKPAYLRRVSELVGQIDPTYYESELATPAAYEEWVAASLAYYTASSVPAARIIPVIPSYRANAWHSPVVENIATGTTGIASALAAGSRVNGAGIWWWYGFYDDESGRYSDHYAAADRSAWLTSTLSLRFTP